MIKIHIKQSYGMKALLRIYLRTAAVNTFELLKNDIWISCIHFKPANTAASHRSQPPRGVRTTAISVAL